MSRALDPRVKEALKVGDHTPVYQCVADVLSSREEELLDIEVLGPSHVLPDGTYILHEDNAVAIPKFNILRAFLPAYKAFKKHISDQNVAPEEVLRATSVILLLDPEHMTAANARKRHIQFTKEQNPDRLNAVLDAEFYLLDSLLTSRLHRHTKSPTLWGHRQWLLELCQRLPQQPQQRRPMDSLPAALARLIFISAERHPRNYYAWCHARYLLGAERRRSQGRRGDEQGQRATQQPTRHQPQDTETLATSMEMVKKWCFSHPDDISGWSFLTVLVEQQQQQHGQEEQSSPPAVALFSETLRLAEAYSWKGESVWYFLRNMLLRNQWLADKTTCVDEFERVLAQVHGKVAVLAALDEQVQSNTLAWTKQFADAGR